MLAVDPDLAKRDCVEQSCTTGSTGLLKTQVVYLKHDCLSRNVSFLTIQNASPLHCECSVLKSQALGSLALSLVKCFVSTFHRTAECPIIVNCDF